MITINKTRKNTETWQYAYVSLTADKDICKVVISTPIENAQAYCDTHEDEIKINVLNAMYPNARWQNSEGETNLEKFEFWIASGAINLDYKDEEKKVIEGSVVKKVPWVDMFGEETEIDKLKKRIAVLEGISISE